MTRFGHDVYRPQRRRQAGAGNRRQAQPRHPGDRPGRADKTDFFCVGEASGDRGAARRGWQVVELRDGYYEDGRGGGVAIWGQGKYWEIRADAVYGHGSVRPRPHARNGRATAEHVEVRRAIFGA